MSTLDNPGTSLFQGNDIKIGNNSQNIEEEEDLEDQIRRREELQNLLSEALDDFKYDESTINSTTNTSIASAEGIDNYRETNAEDQLQLLYDIRSQELLNLKKEFDKYKNENKKEIENLKKKLILSEADLRQVQLSLENAESLLVEKTAKINALNKELQNKEEEIKQAGKKADEYENEIALCKSIIKELQVKAVDNHPFSLGAQRFKSEELNKVHEDQIAKLESQLMDQKNKTDLSENEKFELQKELKRIMDMKEELAKESKYTMERMSQSLDSAQQQCKDLLDVVEVLTKENRHLKDRIKSFERDESILDIDSFRRKSLDRDGVLLQLEKVKRLLVDKSIEVDTLSHKLKNYDNAMKELLQYNKLKSSLVKIPMSNCGQPEHLQDLLVMKNELQNLERTINDKNQQIQNLTVMNKELQDKIESMLLQTRKDICNLSNKYSLPQLEIMSEELKSAEIKIKDLEETLDKIQEENKALLKRIENGKTDDLISTKQQLENAHSLISSLQQTSEEQKRNMQELKNKFKSELDKFENEIENLKRLNEQLSEENNRLLSDVENLNSKSEKKSEDDGVKSEYEHLKNQLKNILINVSETKNQKIKNPKVVWLIKTELEEVLNNISSLEINYIKEKLIDWQKQIDLIEFEDDLNKSSDDSLKKQLMETAQNLQKAQKEISKLKESIEDITNAKTLVEGEKFALQYQLKDHQSQLDQATKDIKIFYEELTKLKEENEEKGRRLKEFESSCKEVTKERIDCIQKQLEKKAAELVEKNEIEAALRTDNSKILKELENVQNCLRLSEEEKHSLHEIVLKSNEEIESLKKEILNLQKQILEAKSAVVKEQKISQSEENLFKSESFQNNLKMEAVKIELALREQLQNEYSKKLKDVEKKYQRACSNNCNEYKRQIDTLKNEEIKYRTHVSQIVSDCAQKVTELEQNKADLVAKLQHLHKEYEEYKKCQMDIEKRHKQMIKKVKIEAEKSIEDWKTWSQQFLGKCLDIEKLNKNCRDKLFIKMNDYDSQVAEIEKEFQKKLNTCS